jgi:hypothetical protein
LHSPASNGIDDLGKAPRNKCGWQKPNHTEGKPSHSFRKKADSNKNKEDSAANTLPFFLA